jgi:hypothetical protein
MLRAWLLSALGVGIVVAVILFSREDPGGEVADIPRRNSPAPLAYEEVETYITVMPQVKAKLGEVAEEVMRRWSAAGRYPDDPELDLRAQTIVDQVLASHHLTRASFTKVRNRVEYAVDVVRWEQEADRRNAKLDAQIIEKEQLLEMAGGDAMRKQLEQDLDRIRAQRTDEGPPLHERSRTMVKQNWAALARIAPARGAPGQTRPGAGPRGG